MGGRSSAIVLPLRVILTVSPLAAWSTISLKWLRAALNAMVFMVWLLCTINCTIFSDAFQAQLWSGKSLGCYTAVMKEENRGIPSRRSSRRLLNLFELTSILTGA